MHKLRQSKVFGAFVVDGFRAMERLLPIPALYAIFYFYSFHRLRREMRPPLSAWPVCLGWPRKGPAPFRWATRRHANHALRYLPDRLTAPNWRRRCQIIGMERLRTARKRGPVILAFTHSGPYFVIGVWLRARDFPTAILRLGSIQHRSQVRLRMDRYTPFPAVPSVLYMDQLRDIPRIFDAGGSLMVAIDEWGGPAVKLMSVPFGDGQTKLMPTGPMRLAARYGATLLPCSIAEEGRWRYRINLGKAVPGEYLRAPDGFVEAGKHLLSELTPASSPRAAPVFAGSR